MINCLLKEKRNKGKQEGRKDDDGVGMKMVRQGMENEKARQKRIKIGTSSNSE